MTTLMMDRALMGRQMLPWGISPAALRRLRGEGRLEAFGAPRQPKPRRHLPKIWLGRGAEQQFVPDDGWPIWLVVGGRGAGKTRAGAEWVNGMAGGVVRLCRPPPPRLPPLGRTLFAVRAVTNGGPAGPGA